ncbi:MAG: hypothetical protein AAF449_12415, partial [Myxococcota bacterium]
MAVSNVARRLNAKDTVDLSKKTSTVVHNKPHAASRSTSSRGPSQTIPPAYIQNAHESHGSIGFEKASLSLKAPTKSYAFADKIGANTGVSDAIRPGAHQSIDFGHKAFSIGAPSVTNDKADRLRALMEGGTTGAEKKEMAQILLTIESPEALQTVLTKAGGADGVWDALGGRQRKYIDALKAHGADGQAMVALWTEQLSVGDAGRRFVIKYVDSDVINAATNDQKTAMIDRIRHGRPGDRELETVRDILQSAGSRNELLGLAAPLGGVATVLDIPSTPANDAALTQSLATLLSNANFSGLTSDEQTDALAQLRNYPDTRAVDNLDRLADKNWYRAMSSSDKQRSAKMVAFLSQHDAGDRTILDNTLGHFLAPGARRRFSWDAPSTSYGQTNRGNIDLNRRFLPANDRPVNEASYNEMHVTAHTMAHELSHLLNRDNANGSYDHFMAEYRAFYVGYTAEHGRQPTRQEMTDRAQVQLTRTDGSYRLMADSLDDPGTQAQIVNFMSRLLGRPIGDLNRSNILTLNPVNPNTPATPPDGVQNMDNR